MNALASMSDGAERRSPSSGRAPLADTRVTTPAAERRLGEDLCAPSCPHCGPVDASELVVAWSGLDRRGAAVARVVHAGGCGSIFEHHLTAPRRIRVVDAVTEVATTEIATTEIATTEIVEGTAVDSATEDDAVDLADVQIDLGDTPVDLTELPAEANDEQVEAEVEVDVDADAAVEVDVVEVGADTPATLEEAASAPTIVSLFAPSDRRTAVPPVEVTPVRALAALTPAPERAGLATRTPYRPAIGLRTPLALRRHGGGPVAAMPGGEGPASSGVEAEEVAVATTTASAGAASPSPETTVAPTFSFNRTVNPGVTPAHDSDEARGRGRAPIVVRGRTTAPVVVGHGPITTTGTAVGQSSVSDDEDDAVPAALRADAPETGTSQERDAQEREHEDGVA